MQAIQQLEQQVKAFGYAVEFVEQRKAKLDMERTVLDVELEELQTTLDELKREYVRMRNAVHNEAVTALTGG